MKTRGKKEGSVDRRKKETAQVKGGDTELLMRV